MAVSDEERARVAAYLRDRRPVTWEGMYRAVTGREIPLDTSADEDARVLCGRLAEMVEPRDGVPDHAKTEPTDSWELVEDDATLEPATYCWLRGVDEERGFSCSEQMARDLVRRCRALAGRDS